ncbi:MAG: MATE family efflux transporter [Hyphomicrobiaceae bacterium]
MTSELAASDRLPPRLGHAEVLKIAVPITLSNATVPLIGFVDTAVIGQMGVPHLMGGVAIGALIFNMLYWGFSFLRMGTTGLTAQAVGAQDRREIAGHLLRAVMIALAGGVLLVLLQAPIRWGAFWLLGGSAEVQAAAATYFDIRIWAAPAGLVNFALLGWLIGLGRAGLAFAIQLLLNLLNMGLAILFALGLGGGVAGVGYAALIAEVVAALIGCAGAIVIARRMGVKAPIVDAIDRVRLARSFAINADITVRAMAAYAVHTFFTSQGAAAGDIVLAANALLITIKNVTIYLLDGFAFAAEALVGRAVGARDRAEFQAAIRLTTIWAGGLAVLVALAIWFGGPAVIAFSAKNVDIQAAAGTYLFWAALAPLVGVWCFQLDGIFIGATRTRDMRNTMILSVLVYIAVAMALLPMIGNHALWAAYLVFYVVRAVGLLACLPRLMRSVFG